ncbi:MAG: adenylate cyclase [Novosphingobium sp.]
MATVAAAPYSGDQRFFSRMAIGIAIFILFGFAQFAARGFVNYQTAPFWVHLHGLFFISWVTLFVVQNVLAERGAIGLHRKLGWLAVAVAAVIVPLTSFTGIMAITLHRQPPFFTPPYFLALTQVGAIFFGGMVAAAIIKRRQTEWHRRLMLSATVLVLEPAFGRTLPMPLLGAELGEAIAGVLQVAILGIAMLHDRKHRGAIHPALFWGAGAVIMAHVLVSLLSGSPVVIAVAERLGG